MSAESFVENGSRFRCEVEYVSFWVALLPTGEHIVGSWALLIPKYVHVRYSFSRGSGFRYQTGYRLPLRESLMAGAPKEPRPSDPWVSRLTTRPALHPFGDRGYAQKDGRGHATRQSRKTRERKGHESHAFAGLLAWGGVVDHQAAPVQNPYRTGAEALSAKRSSRKLTMSLTR
jgi:hypothetical protein